MPFLSYLWVGSRKTLEVDVVERMYDWSLPSSSLSLISSSFSCCWKDVRLKQAFSLKVSASAVFQLLLKGCTIEALSASRGITRLTVSVVVERMYDWSVEGVENGKPIFCFSCCWKDVRLKLWNSKQRYVVCKFQLLLKGCTIEAQCHQEKSQHFQFQLLLKGCTIEANRIAQAFCELSSFSCCWKDVRLKLKPQH